MSPAADTLRGSLVPLVTPFCDGEVDYETFDAAVDRHVQEGSRGVVVTGTTGEPTSLNVAERSELYRRAVDVAAGRIVVVAATGSANHAETLELTRAAEGSGVDAVLVVCPAFVKPSPDGLVAHMVAVAASTELPFLIYNIPGRSGVGITPAGVERVADQAPNLVGLKHASNDLDFVTDVLLRLGEDFRLFCGLESYSYPFLVLGGAGLMSAVGNLAPARLAALCESVADGDHGSALSTHRELFAINQAVFFETNPVPLKAMMAAAGLGSAEVRLPLTGATDGTRRRLDAILPDILSLTGRSLA